MLSTEPSTARFNPPAKRKDQLLGTKGLNRMKGRIHSIETFGTVDGPGIRFVLFMQGCALRCQYCHNPDTWDTTKGREVSVEDIINEIEPYIEYYRRSGGG